VRAAIAKRHAEALRRADRDIGTHRASRSHQECGQWVDADRELAACGMQCVGKRCDIAQPTEGIRALHMRTEDGEYYLMEMNPRFPAWVYLAVGCGQNHPEALVDLALGQKPPAMNDYEVGKMFIRYSQDLVVSMQEFEKISTLGEL